MGYKRDHRKSGRASGMVPLILSLCLAPGFAADYSQQSNAAQGWLAGMQDATGNGLVDSFEDNAGDGSPIPLSYTYDQAVAAIAFLLKGETQRAKNVLTRMSSLQAAEGSWCNSYWYNNYYGQELRLHVGPAMWMALAVMNYEKITGDTATYHSMAIKAIDWCLQFQKTNGAMAGGRTTWDAPPAWTDEVWSSTEHNVDAYPALLYFAKTTPAKSAGYNTAAARVKSFLDSVAWDNVNGRFFGGYKNNIGQVDSWVPMDVNPWGVLALGAEGTHHYQAALAYVEGATGDPATLAKPRYKYSLAYGGGAISAYDFDWQGNGAAGDPAKGGGVLGPDIWFEGSAFMSCAYRLTGDTLKADDIISEIVKKQGKDGSKAGGIPYSLNGTNNNYWLMAKTNCVSSTGWLIIAIAHWNPFKAESIDGATGLHQAHGPVGWDIGVHPFDRFGLEFQVSLPGHYAVDLVSASGRTLAAFPNLRWAEGRHVLMLGWRLRPGIYFVIIMLFK
jgi:hypothetical protein